jgi:hypothetical protein
VALEEREICARRVNMGVPEDHQPHGAVRLDLDLNYGELLLMLSVPLIFLTAMLEELR